MRLPGRRTLKRIAKRVLPRTYLDDVRRERRIAESIRRSGLFDVEWYTAQLGRPLPAGVDPIDHYVGHGAETGVSPNPCFDPDWYMSRPNAPRRLDVTPFVHYINRGAGRGISPHPLFDSATYLRRHPEAKGHPGGPLGHYLEKGWRTGEAPSAAFDPEVYANRFPEVQGPPLRDFAMRVRRVLDETRGSDHLPRTADSFDHEAAQRFTEQIRAEYAALGEEPPLVTIVIPTKDRLDGVVTAVESVLAQTYRNWQLIVVDDGSTDDTVGALQRYADDQRIEVIRREHSGGVSVARNVGLAQARGAYVAYLDSDNTWVPEFLEVMVAFVRTRGLRFGYAVSELIEDKANGRTGYRNLPFDKAALIERNFIDCIVVLHERSLLDEVGPFDENLRRNVDWDLFIRMAQVTDFALAPFVATQYDAWERRSDRITINEPFGYRYVIRAKHLLDWDAAEAALPQRSPGSVSVVLHAHDTAPELTAAVEQLVAVTREDVEIIVVDAKLADSDALQAQFLPLRFPQVSVLRQTQKLSAELARTIGALASHGETIVFLTADTRVEADWLEPLLAPLAAGEAAATQPRVLLPDGTVWSAGLAFARDAHAHSLFRRFPGDAPEVVAGGTRAALAATCLAVRAADFVAVRGFDPLYVNDLDSGDLSLRLAAQGEGEPAYVAESIVSLLAEPERPATATSVATTMDNQELFAVRWADTVAVDDHQRWHESGFRIVGYSGDATTHAGFDPVVVRDREQRPLRWALKIGAPSVDRRLNWGDWHFAVALKDSLQRLGQEVVIDCKTAWERPTSIHDDVTVVLRGVSPYTPNPQHINLLWVISHPERVTRREMAGFDDVFAASTSLARRYSTELGSPVTPLLQCTDQHRFHPVPPHPTRRHEVLFVGNARGMRASVGTALEAGIVPTVYGLRWGGLVPDGAWQSDYLANEELPATYGAAGAVLNDHWDDMRRDGLLSNRLFDLAACGARVITDDVPGLSEVFGPAFLTYDSPETMAEAVKTHLSETPERAKLREELSETVRREHTFDARALTLVEAAQKLQAARDIVRTK